jgi:hypothetical protein
MHRAAIILASLVIGCAAPIPAPVDVELTQYTSDSEWDVMRGETSQVKVQWRNAEPDTHHVHIYTGAPGSNPYVDTLFGCAREDDCDWPPSSYTTTVEHFSPTGCIALQAGIEEHEDDAEAGSEVIDPKGTTHSNLTERVCLD